MNLRPCLLVITLLFSSLMSAAFAQMVTTPNIIGMSEPDAREALAVAGFEGKIHVEVDSGEQCVRSDVKEGHVCGQSPGATETQAAFLDVWLILQGRRARENGEQVAAAPEVQIPPELSGMSEEQAIEKLVAAGFTGAITVSSDIECPKPEGTVCTTRPPFRRRVPADADVTVFVQPKRTNKSRYGQPPEVLGMPIAQAIDALFAQNFRALVINYRDDVRCNPGIVCNVLPTDEIISRGSSIQIAIGTEFPGREKTPNYRQLDLIGDDLPNVLKKADAMGTKARVSTDPRGRCGRFDEPLPPRTVCDQSPPPGQETSGQFTSVSLTPDAEVATQVASSGTMPNVIGMPIDKATTVLNAAGLTRTRVKELSDANCQSGTVCSTSPEAGKKAYAQLVQTLYIGATESLGGVMDETNPESSGDYDEDYPMDDPTTANIDSNSDSLFDEAANDEEVPEYEPLFPEE